MGEGQQFLWNGKGGADNFMQAKRRVLKMPCTIYKCIFMSKFKKIILFNRLNT